jgi:glycine/D-amino acid oxidase-like deaminating enzyme
MIVLFLGYRTHNRSEVPAVLYCGNDANEGLRQVAEKADGFVRVGRVSNLQPIPVAIPETAAAKKLREEQEAQERQNQAEAAAKAARERATAAKAKAEKEIAEAEQALRVLDGKPADPEAAAKAEAEKAEAEKAKEEAESAEADAKAKEEAAAAEGIGKLLEEIPPAPEPIAEQSPSKPETKPAKGGKKK